MDSHPDLRIGDPERGRALDQLTELFTSGYLDVNEFDSRTAAAAGAVRQSDLDKLFRDLPSPPEPCARDAGVARPSNPDAELDRVLERGKKVRAADTAIWSITMILFFLGLFVFEWNFFWVVFPIAGFASIAARGIYGLGDEEEEIFDELAASEKEKRAERLRVAMERRKQLEQ
ncbi:protein of unknown function [Corynebacterium mycetoides]|uniref:DUF1707 domain-containing protein n=1 Tax=Corynebacterium mycetoides TaxID=38302 RepID=A0A1G9QH74_9CORY|nr:DUF1707 domain-containing protein [Corynebacterium mycetoides]SDM10388.1 protein of unknown function [Corynebacterium mycetoides]